MPEKPGERDDDEAHKASRSAAACAEAADEVTILNAEKKLAAVLQALELSECTCARRRSQFDGKKTEQAVRLNDPEDENRRLKPRAALRSLDS